MLKIIEANENSKFLIRDEDFNYQEVEYNVNWIDKNPPVISGAENGKIYTNDPDGFEVTYNPSNANTTGVEVEYKKNESHK